MSPISVESPLSVSVPSPGPDHYADVVSHPAPHPSIPAAALARKARLQSTLQAMEAASPSREPACLLGLRALLHGGMEAGLDVAIAQILAEDCVEEAVELLRVSVRAGVDRARIEPLAARLAPLAVRSQQRRTARWQLDTRRLLVRCAFSKGEGAIDFDDGDLHAVFLQAFRLEGIPLALDLGKRPRPLLSLGLPLPSGVGGQQELLDAILKREPVDDPASVMARLNRRLPEGLGIHRWDGLPGFVSPVAELATQAHWSWGVPAAIRPQVEENAVAFLRTGQWPWNRGAAKEDMPLDLKELIADLRWEQDRLCFATRLEAFSAMNPLKMLGAALDLESARIQGLVRTGVDLKPDPRLDQGERFQPKLKNMYEDAVLLGGGSNIILVEDDDDEPLHLG